MARTTTSTPPTSLHEPPQGPGRTKPSSSHLDPSLSHFTNPAFDPVDYLNSILPPLSLSLSLPPSPISLPRTSSSPTATITPKDQPAAATTTTTTTTTTISAPVSLAALSTQTQSLVSQLSAQNARLSNTLTQLTDEILRGGGRLAYEVEVLRGEAVGLSDALGEGLAGDIERFVPGGKILDTATSTTTKSEAEAEAEIESETGATADTAQSQTQAQTQERTHQQQQSRIKEIEATPATNEPLYLTHLRTLTNVRARLEQVIHTFGEAMEWPLAPSETSLASSFISVSAPEPGTENQHSREEKGKEVARKMRADIVELLNKDTDADAKFDGLEEASRKVEALRELAVVWKGTAEEKARMKFVDGLAKMVEERRRIVESEREKKAGGTANRQRGDSNAGRSQEGGSAPGAGAVTASGGAGGLFRNLQRLRDEIYLD